MDETGVELWKGSAEPWECDAMGHMNVRFYVAKAMEALGVLAARLGMPGAWSREAQATLAVREMHVRYLREARAGTGLVIRGGVLDWGEAEARLLLVMRHLTGEPAASFRVQVEHVTAGERRAFPWPGRMAPPAQALRVEAPAFAAARGVGEGPVESQASLARAEALGLACTAMGLVGPQDCDVFGRMRPEMLVARISDGVPHQVAESQARPATGPDTPAPRLGGAAVEHRLLYFEPARAGARVELRSGLAFVDRRVRRVVHWLLDPDSGRAFAAAEAVAISLDLAARKAVELSPDEQAAVAAHLVPGLAL